MNAPGEKRVRVPRKLQKLLGEVLTRRLPSLAPLLQVDAGLSVSTETCRQVQSALSDELVASGLKSDDEPNSRGLDLEALIDVFSPYG